MPNNYDKVFQLFLDYVNRQLTSVRSRIKNAEFSDKIREIYDQINGKNYNVCIDNYQLLSRISANVKTNLQTVDFLDKNGIASAPQMDIALKAIIDDKDLQRIVDRQYDKESLLAEEERLTSILEGRYDFESFKSVLLNSDLSLEDIITILDYEAEKSIVVEKKQLPSLENKNKAKLDSYQELIKRINGFVEKYYYLIEGKPSNLIEMYKKVLANSNIEGINKIYSQNDVLLCIHLLHLKDLLSEAEGILKEEPVDMELLEISEGDLTSSYEDAKKVSEKFEKEKSEDMPLDANLFFMLDRTEDQLDLDSFSQEDQKSILSCLQDLESGLFDYKRGKGNHTKVIQNIKKSLNVFINKKGNIAVSYVRINSKDLKDSKVLVLCIDSLGRIFDSSISLLNSRGELLDDFISKVESLDPVFVGESTKIKDSIYDKLSRKEVSHHE